MPRTSSPETLAKRVAVLRALGADPGSIRRAAEAAGVPKSTAHRWHRDALRCWLARWGAAPPPSPPGDVPSTADEFAELAEAAARYALCLLDPAVLEGATAGELAEVMSRAVEASCLLRRLAVGGTTGWT